MLTKNLVSFTPKIKSDTFTFIVFTIFGTQNQAYESLTVLQLPPHMLALTVNGQKRDSVQFILTSVALA